VNKFDVVKSIEPVAVKKRVVNGIRKYKLDFLLLFLKLSNAKLNKNKFPRYKHDFNFKLYLEIENESQKIGKTDCPVVFDRL